MLLKHKRGYHVTAVAYSFGFHIKQTRMSQTPQITERQVGNLANAKKLEK